METKGPEAPSLDGHILFSLDTDVLNISIGGAALTADQKLDVGAGLRLELEGSGEHMALDGLVAWCLRGEAMAGQGARSGGFRVGMQFAGIEPDRVAELVNFIETHKRSEESRLGGLRFNIFSPERAVLHYQRRFKVASLGPSGLTVETRADIREGQRLRMEIALREEAACFLGEVAGVRQVSGQSGAFFEADVAFAEMAEAERAKLSAFLDAPL